MTGTLAGVIQARMGSTRLPCKVMMPLADRPMVWHIKDRLERTEGVECVVLATTTDPRNAPMVRFAESNGMAVVQCETEDDIVGRLKMVCDLTNASAIVKVNGDCPLIDPTVLTALVAAYRRDTLLDYVSNKIEWSYPLGLSAELISSRALVWCDDNLTTIEDREFVADWIRDNSDRFPRASVVHHMNLSDHNWAVDEQDDYVFVTEIFEALYRDGETFGMNDVLDYLHRRESKSPAPERASVRT